MVITAFVLAVMFQVAAGQVYTGTFADKPTAENRRVVAEMRSVASSDVPGVKPGDRVLSVRLSQFKSAGAPAGLEVLVIEGATGATLLADLNMDGTITEADRVAEMRDTTNVTGWNYDWELPAGTLRLPVKAWLTVSRTGAAPIWRLSYAPEFRIEGKVDIAGKTILVSLPFKAGTGAVEVANGYIGVDSDGDGKIASGTLSPEYVNAAGKPPVLRIGSRYIAIESADFAARSFVVKERSSSDYILIEVREGSPMQDFSFTDFDGRARKLSDFRGKHVLLDFWGSWCKPCVDDVPAMKEAYDRFRARGFEIVGMDYEMSNASEKVRALLKEKEVAWVNATSESVKGLIDDRFRISTFPTLILLDPKGVVIEARSVELRGKRLMSTLERVFDVK